MSDLTDLSIDIMVEADGWLPEADLTQLCQEMISGAQRVISDEIVSGAEISLVFTNDANIQLLNRDHRGQNKATNVLSFPQCPADSEVFGPLLGDIIIAQETVAHEAASSNTSFEHHLRHLVVHGFLHLLGYDHIEDEEAEEMESLEIEILSQFDVANPYEL